MMKYGVHSDGRKMGPIDPAKVAEDGWEWLDTREGQQARHAEVVAARPPTTADVNAERDRRISEGVTVTLSTGQSVPVDTRTSARDLDNINGLATSAMTGKVSEFRFRGAGNVTHSLTADEMIELGLLAAAHVRAHYEVSWAIKDEIAAGTYDGDIASDERWP